MNVYTGDKIRNVAIMGHGGSGKTTLTEAFALLSGVTTRMGKTTDGNTISDYDKEEQKRQFSIGTSVIPIEWEGNKINFLDTPGDFDFVGEVEEAAGAAAGAVIVVSGKAGVEVGAEKAWEICEKNKLPRIIYVSNMDDPNANYMQIVEDLTAKYGNKIAPFMLPIKEGDRITGYAGLISEAGHKFEANGKLSDMAIPDDVKADLESRRDTLMETVAETSEDFMERYFAGETFTPDEVREAVKQNINDDSIVPVLFGSTLTCQGVTVLLGDVINYFASPNTRKISGTNMKTNETFEANYDTSKEKSAYVWKTIVDPFIGKYSLIKVCSGVLKSDDTLFNYDKNAEERISKLYILRGNKPIEVSELQAGDIGAIPKLTSTATGDTLSTKACPIKYEPTEVSKPYTCMRYNAKNKADIDKISGALQKMMQEDQTIKNVNDAENRQTLIYGMGDKHLEIIQSKLLNVYKCDIELMEPKVAYRETIRKNSDVESKYKKQSGGHGQYGHVKMKFEPLGTMDKAYEFEQIVVGGAVPKNYFPAVEKGLADSVQKGPLAAYPVVGIKAILYDGSYHPVDSSEQAFKMATIQAFKKGIMDASPVLLEPIASLKVTVPDDFTGDVMGDLNKRRGRVLGMNPTTPGKTCIEAEIPMTGLYGYCTILRSMTGGRGNYEYEFVRYEQAPQDVQEKEVAARASKLTDDAED
ncbi:MAG: elongation factor G [Lachnospiraceae bacterium]|nr:elongation factor G [Lachnospiraceae bacterium]